MDNKNDLAIVLGTRFGENWTLRQDLVDRLDNAVEMYMAGEIKTVLVSGKWTVWYDWLDISPPTTEAKLMKKYLEDKGVSPKDIIKEERSKDTIGSIYYLGMFLETKTEFKRLLIICPPQRLGRIEFLVDKILPKKYTVSYSLVDAPHDKQSSLGDESEIFKAQTELFENVDFSLRYDLYSHKYYTDQAKAVQSGACKSELVD